MNANAWRATVIHPDDDVAVALEALEPGAVRVRRGGDTVTLALGESIPMGHKLSLRDIPAGTPVKKYGEAIGVATENIAAGRHVHVHNVRSRRAGAKNGESA